MAAVWDETAWGVFEAETRRSALQAPTESGAWEAISRHCRTVLRSYSTSFFLVTRFLPPSKRAQVEVIYAAVRYPDEIVDTFPLEPEARIARLDRWEEMYERALCLEGMRHALSSDIHPVLAAFAHVVRDRGIPAEHYRSFLSAMRLDIEPCPFPSLDDLIEIYIYGSATVVGYFLAYVYGSTTPANFERALASSRHLAIALQLTNFLRDVAEDHRRGRVYIPVDLLRVEGIETIDVDDAGQRASLDRVLHRMSVMAETYYALAEVNLDAFSADCLDAIRACIHVYRQLNTRVGLGAKSARHRESVPMTVKFRVLPPSKYWRLPLAYIGVL